jgi:hypothetical protein
MGLGENFKRRWRAAAETRRQARWYIASYFAALICMGLGAFDGRFFLVGLLGIPYAAFGMIYSDPSSPKSYGAWYFYLFFSISLFLLLLAISLSDKQGFTAADLVTVTLLTHIAYSQLRLLFKARKQYFVPVEIHDIRTTNRDYLG